MTRVPKRARLSRMAMPWKPVVSEPHRRMVAMSAMTTPPSPTKARCSRRPRGGRRSRSMRRKPVTASTAAGPMMRRLMTGTGIISVMARGSPSWRGQGHRGRRLRLHLGDEGAHARLRLSRERHGIDADPEDEGEHGHEDDPLARREIGQAPVLLPRHLAEDHALIHPQHVDGGEDDAVVAMTARGRLTWKAPTRMRNSPTKPLSPGSPMDENVTTRKSTDSAGTIFHSPPKSTMSRVCRRS